MEKKKKENKKFTLLGLSKLLLGLAYAVGGAYVIYAFVNLMRCKGTGKIFDIRGIDFYDSMVYPILIILLLSVLIASIHFILKNKGAKRVFMYIIGGLTILASIGLLFSLLFWAVTKWLSLFGIQPLLSVIGKLCIFMLPVMVIACTIVLATTKETLKYIAQFYLSFFITICIIPLMIASMSHPFLAICLVVGTVITAIIIIKCGLDTSCPNCNKWFSYRSIGKEVIGRKETTVKTKIETKSKRTGEVAYVTDAYVPGIETTYKVHYQCSKCKYTNHYIRTEKKEIS